MFLDNRAKFPIDATVPTPVVKKAIELGDTTAQYVWAMRLQSGGHGTAKDMDESLRWLKTAAEAGQADAQAQLGYQYLFGTGVAKNEAEGVKWTRKAAHAGNATGLANMGAVYLFGMGGVKRDEKLAGYQFLQAANRKHPRALQLLGEWHEKGMLGFRKNLTDAKSFYRQAAQLGDVKAQEALKRLGE